MRSLLPHHRAAIFALALAMVPDARARVPQSGQEPSSSSVLLGRARTLEQRGRLDLAREDWLQVLTASPNDAEALAGMVRAARAAGRSAEASEYLVRLRAAHPNDAELARLETKSGPAAGTPGGSQDLAEASRLAQTGKAQEAMAIYRRVYGEAPPPGAPALAYYQAEAATVDGRPHAIAGLRALGDRFPNDNRYPVALGKVLLASPRTRAEGRTLLQRYPGDSEALAALKATDKDEHTVASSRTNAALSLGGAAARRDEDGERTERSATLRPASAPVNRSAGSQSAHLQFAAEEQAGLAALNQHRNADAEQIFRGILAKDPGNPRALAGMGYLRVIGGDLKGAVRYFEQAQENGDRSLALTRALVNAQFSYALQQADASAARGDLPSAVSRYQQALSERPSDPEALDGLGGLYLRSGQMAQALPVYARLTKVRPMSPAAWRGLVLAETATGHPAEALSTDAQVPADVKAPLAQDAAYQQALAAARGPQNALIAKAEAPPPPVASLPVPVKTAPPAAGTPAARTPASQPANAHPPAPGAPASAAGTSVASVARPAPPSAPPSPVVAAPPKSPAGKAAPATAPSSSSTAVVASTSMPPARVATSRPAATGSSRSRARSRGSVAASTGVATAPALPVAPPAPAVPSPSPDEAIATERIAQAEAALQRKEAGRAAELFRDALSRQPQRSDAWRGLITALHAEGRDDEAAAAMAKVPAASGPALERDATFQQTEGAILLAQDRPGMALQAWARAQEVFTSQRLAPPLDLAMGVARLLVARGDDANLYRQLMYLGARTDLSDTQRREVQLIWTRWAVRRARALAAQGEQGRAVAVLNAAVEAFSGNAEVVDAVADGYAGVGLPREAVALYKAQDATRESPSELSKGIRAAITARDFKFAESWIRAGRQRFPNDAQILNVAAECEQARGHEQRAADLARQARAVAPAQDPGKVLVAELRESPGGPNPAAGGRLSVLLAPDDAARYAQAGTATRPFLPGMEGSAGPASVAQAPVLTPFDGGTK